MFGCLDFTLHICANKGTQMKSENTNKKTTCNKKCIPILKPEPAEVVAAITGKSVSYVNKVRTGKRADHSESAVTIKRADTLILEGKQVLLKAVAETINKPNN